jgi:hypothetical protein
VRITGTAGQRYAVERAAALPGNWTQIGTADNTNGTAEFLDTPRDGGPRFYRSRLTGP